MEKYINLLKENNLLKIIDKPCDIELEIAHISYIEVKKDDTIESKPQEKIPDAKREDETPLSKEESTPGNDSTPLLSAPHELRANKDKNPIKILFDFFIISSLLYLSINTFSQGI